MDINTGEATIHVTDERTGAVSTMLSLQSVFDSSAGRGAFATPAVRPVNHGQMQRQQTVTVLGLARLRERFDERQLDVRAALALDRDMQRVVLVVFERGLLRADQERGRSTVSWSLRDDNVNAAAGGGVHLALGPGSTGLKIPTISYEQERKGQNRFQNASERSLSPGHKR